MRQRGKWSQFFRLGVMGVTAFLIGTSAISARDFKGVSFPDEMKIGQDVCQLTGIGIRKKFFVTVYYGGLYLQQHTTDRRRVIDMEQPKAVLIHVVYKEVTGQQWVDGWKEGFAANTPHPDAKLQEKINTFLSCFDEPVKSGQTVQISYLPDRGTEVIIQGRQKAVIPGHDFMAALWSIWFGEHPASQSLMEGMLGK
ncbi:chalcone isomerase family protein [Desulfoferrobacter suflitae]|uniref:chalcone isomerase family protein n=1 Tax=Desulfoferrobacter suflitae TaxID=2865782 RepID=UPI00216400E2|nr:chalcone isomerase family protein [Desulfoferrobacter suflitae]MCK8602902.1 chalcone isomerase family protein [Desulfoferrobacter suflitae]